VDFYAFSLKKHASPAFRVTIETLEQYRRVVDFYPVRVPYTANDHFQFERRRRLRPPAELERLTRNELIPCPK
jgi:hypothetical protein